MTKSKSEVNIGGKNRKRSISSKNERNESKDDTDIEEVKFGIKSNDIAKAAQAAIKLHSENPKLENQLFEDRIPLFLQVNSHVVPKGPSRIFRLPIPNTLVTPDDEICLIVPDVKGIKNAEHEKHLDHYETLLRNKGVDNIKKIMTFHEFRTEYETYEQKLRLVDLYDTFLVDGKISGKVVHKCGKVWYKKRKLPTPIKLQATKLKEHIDKALSKAFFFCHLKGDSYTVQFGHDKMGSKELIENVFAVLEGLNKEFPGGFENIKGVHVSATRSTSIPIYSSFKSPAEVTVSNVKRKRPKSFKTYRDELTTLPNAEVVVMPTGRVLVKRKTKAEDGNQGNTGESEKKSASKKAKKRKQKKPVEENTESVEAEDGPGKKRAKKINGVGNSESVEQSAGTEDVPKKKKTKKMNGVTVNSESGEQAVGTEDGPVRKKMAKKINGVEENSDSKENIVKKKKKGESPKENGVQKVGKVKEEKKSNKIGNVNNKEKKNKVKVKKQS